MDMDASGCSWGASLRLKVGINVNLPLKRALKIRTTIGEEQLLSFIYERIPNFCYLCGHLGHITKYCDSRFNDDFKDTREDTPYGPWLRAPLLTKGSQWNTKTETQQPRNTASSSQLQPSRRGSAIFRGFSAQWSGDILALKARTESRDTKWMGQETVYGADKHEPPRAILS
ncbi:UNVERIFIED_CONTAM: hypothetical protein Slati_2155100 [Sesamum latifolium]|uniref:CCHC-type domain-containing protein n=1 Tax=Sesamum latifolium TaxID=2727402 RepID=A0AAW2WRA1_9LAMI